MRAVDIDNLAGCAPYMSLVQGLRERANEIGTEPGVGLLVDHDRCGRVPQEHHASTSAVTATRQS